jgi:subtilisin family serine protease
MSMTCKTAIGATECWCPSEADDAIFGQRSMAERLLEVPCLRDEKGLTGKNVNVVIIDYGLNADHVPNFAGGWTARGVKPGKTEFDPNQSHGGHGMMVAANIRKIANDVRIFDLPMIPPTGIHDIPSFFKENANQAFAAMLKAIAKQSSHFILVNAWAIYDRDSEKPPGNYTNNPDHPFNQLMDEAVAAGHDVVFGAGNCGAFCPSPRCGAGDQGPGRSIFGANSHPKVLTVGAVRSDRIWLGYSSQGPGQPRLETKKPDLCAPSDFMENDDAGTSNHGTSAACALAAGVLAGLRGKWTRDAVSPERMKTILTQTTTKTSDAWSAETGYGILNARNAHDELVRLFPKP